MTEPPVLDEAARRRVIDAYDVGGALKAHALDDISDFAARLCDAPVALVTLIEEEEQHFLARVGTDLSGTPRDISFCAHAIGGSDLLEVRDATQDPRFAANPLVTGETNVRFYAGVPLIAREGVALGGVCVLDTEPRPEGLTDVQRDGLKLLADLVMRRLEDHRRRREQAESARALAESEIRFRTLADTMPQMVWSTLPNGFHDYYNARWYEYTGVPQGSTDGEGWNGMFHPEDQPRAWEIWRHSLATGDPYQIEYRLRHADGNYRWVLGRALPIREASENGDGAIVRWFGTCTDIHEQKETLEQREVLAQELSHRIKNIFAVIAGLIAFAARGRPEFASVAADLRQRITALGRAHDFVRPHSPASRPMAQPGGLHGLLEDLFEAYQRDDERRIAVNGDDVAIDDRSATPLALLFHELATNATKYGALSVPGGHIQVEVAAEGERVTIVWREAGGPFIATAPEPSGFGSRLIELSAVRQLGGDVDRDWRPDGLVATISAPLASFRRA